MKTKNCIRKESYKSHNPMLKALCVNFWSQLFLWWPLWIFAMFHTSDWKINTRNEFRMSNSPTLDILHLIFFSVGADHSHSSHFKILQFSPLGQPSWICSRTTWEHNSIKNFIVLEITRLMYWVYETTDWTTLDNCTVNDGSFLFQPVAPNDCDGSQLDESLIKVSRVDTPP